MRNDSQTASRSEPTGESYWPLHAALLLAVVLTLSWNLSLAAVELPRVLPVLSTAKSVHELEVGDARKGYPVHLRATVTYYDPYIDARRRPALFVSDASGSIFVALAATASRSLRAGDLVDVSGVTGGGDFAPIVDQGTLRVVGHTHVPGQAPRVSMTEMLANKRDGQWVEIEGVVHAVRRSGYDEFLDLKLRDGSVSAGTVWQPGVDYSSLVDAKVVVRGNEAPLFNHRGQLTGAHLLFPDLSTVRVEEPGPAHPFDSPARKIDSLMKYTAASGSEHRVHVRGIVTLYWPGRLVCLRDGAWDASGGGAVAVRSSLCAQTSQSSRVEAGDMADVIGFSGAGDFTPTLTNAQIQTEYQVDRPRPLALTAEQAMLGNHDAELVSVEGRLIGYDRAANDPTLVLSAGSRVFSVVLAGSTMQESIEEGTLLEVTGICSLQSDRAATVDFPVARSMRLLLRSPLDIRVVRRPSWWNIRHTLAVLALALATTLVALGGVLILVRRVKRQQSLLRESEEQFRHLATHDHLTALPNRNAILAILVSSLKAAKEHQRGVCLAIIDLDHFKTINDTFGHMAGDEVLRQAAARLSSAIRDSDVIGRYGGEEFLMVLRNVNRQMSMDRCEAIRSALAREPVLFGDQALPITCSIGVAYTGDGSACDSAMIMQADGALYKAKARGRNRVEAMFFDQVEGESDRCLPHPGRGARASKQGEDLRGRADFAQSREELGDAVEVGVHAQVCRAVRREGDMKSALIGAARGAFETVAGRDAREHNLVHAGGAEVFFETGPGGGAGRVLGDQVI